jgi:hypothetical protein
MTAPSVTNSFANGTTADATAVNQNFSDLISAMTDGSKSFSIDALTCAGAATFNGAVSLGNATGDDITVTGYIASDIIPKTDNSFDLGSSSKQFAEIYAKGAVSFGSTLDVTGVATLASATDASSSTAAGTIVSGGLAVAKKAYFGTGVYLPQGGNLLDFYGENTFPTYITDGVGGVGTGATSYYVRIGKIVFIVIPEIGLTTTGTAIYITAENSTSLSWPAALQPARTQNGLLTIKDGAAGIGHFQVSSSGIRLYKSGFAAFGSGSADKGIIGSVVYYHLY